MPYKYDYNELALGSRKIRAIAGNKSARIIAAQQPDTKYVKTRISEILETSELADKSLQVVKHHCAAQEQMNAHKTLERVVADTRTLTHKKHYKEDIEVQNSHIKHETLYKKNILPETLTKEEKIELRAKSKRLPKRCVETSRFTTSFLAYIDSLAGIGLYLAEQRNNYCTECGLLSEIFLCSLAMNIPLDIPTIRENFIGYESLPYGTICLSCLYELTGESSLENPYR